MEVHRPAVGKPLLCPEDSTIVAVASDVELPDVTLPVIGLENVAAIADFIVGHLSLEPRVRNGAA